MAGIFNYGKEQYQFVQDSRAVLFNYCKTISQSHFLSEHRSFGRGGSIRNILVHIANTYEFWIAKHALNKDIVFTTYSSKESIYDVMDLFDQVDVAMDEFITLLEKKGNQHIQYESNGEKNTVTPFKLFSHVITHEFHHKGQILSLSRHLNYIPVDTDIMR